MCEPWIKYEVAPIGPIWAWGVFVADASDHHREADKRQPWRLVDHGVERLQNLAEGLAESRVVEIRAKIVELLEMFASSPVRRLLANGLRRTYRPWSIAIADIWGTEKTSCRVYVSGVNTKLSTPEFERQNVPEFCAAALATIGPGEGRMR